QKPSSPHCPTCPVQRPDSCRSANGWYGHPIISGECRTPPAESSGISASSPIRSDRAIEPSGCTWPAEPSGSSETSGVPTMRFRHSVTVDSPCRALRRLRRIDPVVLDFDHLPGVDKKFEISRAVNASTRSWARIEKEIAKCEVVCANCHRRRTSARAGHRKHLLKMGLPLPTPPDLSTRRAQTPHGG